MTRNVQVSVFWVGFEINPQYIGPPRTGLDTPALCRPLDALFEHRILGNDIKTKKKKRWVQ